MSENPTGIFKRGQEWLKNKIPQKFKSAESREQERTANLEAYIKAGLDLIKQENFKEAIDFFEDEEMAKQLGFSTLTINQIGAATDDPERFSEGDLLAATDICAKKSQFKFGRNYRDITPNDLPPGVSYDQIQNLPPDLDLGKITLLIKGEEAVLPPSVYQNIALIHAEEWLHGLQFFRKSPLAGIEDREVDVAAYMLGHGVTLTPQFLARYKRVAKLNGY